MKNTRRQFVAGLAAIGLARACDNDIFDAAAAGDLNRAKEICKLDPGIVHLRSADGRTPLHCAAAAGQVDMIAFLLSQGADLSAGPESPMIAIADYPDPTVAADMAQLLLANASDPNVKRKDGVTALHLAAARGNTGVVRMLIHRGATVNADDAVRDAASVERVYYGGRYAQDLSGGKVTREDTYGLPQEFINQFVTVSHFDSGKVKQMHKLCPKLLDTRSTWDELAVEAASHVGLEPLAQYLADAGSPVSTCTAVLLGLGDAVKKMIREDRDRLRERGAHDFPLLSYTAWGKERTEIAAFLLEAGANPKAAFGQSPLHVAAGKGYVELAGLLLEHGADVNATTESRKGPGPTPLALAVQRKQSKMADFLTSRGGRM